MKRCLVLGVIVWLSGCASKQTPQELAMRTDKTAPSYHTPHCQAARNSAHAYDDNLAPRIGLSLGLTLLLGPFGSPISLLVDSDQSETKSTVLSDLKTHCPFETSQAQP